MAPGRDFRKQEWLRATQTYYFMVLEVRNLNLILHDYNRGIERTGSL